MQPSHASVLPALALFVDGPIWLNVTVIALVCVTLLSLVGAGFVTAGRRFRWLNRTDEIQLKRKLRVGFGSLFLAAVTLPYLVVEVPMIAASLIIFAILFSIPYAVAGPPAASQSERTTSEHAEID